MDMNTVGMIGGVLLLLIAVSVTIPFLRRYRDYGVDPAVLDTFTSRVTAWWLLFGSLTCAFLFGHVATVLLFLFISFWALREYITLTKTRPADHSTLFWIFFLATPLQFLLVSLNSEWFYGIFGFSTYQVYSILIPAFAFLIIPAAIACSNDHQAFLERVAKIELGLLICVYSLSFAPALLSLDLSGVRALNDVAVTPGIGDFIDEAMAGAVEQLALPVAQEVSVLQKTSAQNWQLLFFFVVIVQLGDVFQYLWSQIRFRHVVAPAINSTRTWEGVLGGAATTALVGTAMWGLTPFPHWWQPGVIAFAVAMMGFAGGITMSAIKRDRGVEDYGSLIEGHNGVLDRIDSLFFAAPVYFHLVCIFVK